MISRLAWLGALTLVVGAANAAGCGSSPTATAATTGGTTGSGGGGGAAPASYGKSACGACVVTACASQLSACNADPECPAFLTCLDACPVGADGNASPACVAACPVGTGTESQRAAAGINACRTVGAGAACAPCGVIPPTTYTAQVLNETCPNKPPPENVCFTCEDSKCCQAEATCHASAACGALKTCLATCTDTAPGCQKACVAATPAGADVLGPLLACTRVLCAADEVMCNKSLRTMAEACVYGTCGDEYAAFLASKGGYALEACDFACAMDDAACDQLCYNAYPDAFARFVKVSACVGTATACKTHP